MKRRTVGTIRVMAHERLVEVEYGKHKIKAVVFGQDGMKNFFVCFARPELEAVGITGHGPCLNKVISATKVTFLDGAQPVVVEEEEEDETD